MIRFPTCQKDAKKVTFLKLSNAIEFNVHQLKAQYQQSILKNCDTWI